MRGDLTKGPVMKSMLNFAVPMFLGNLLQQCYNVADTLIVGKYIGSHALAAVGSSFTLMTFLTSVLLGLSIGSGVFFSIRFGQKDYNGLKEGICASFVFIASVTLLLNILVFIYMDEILYFLQVPKEVWGFMEEYLFVIFCGITATFLYNYFASLLRAIGNSVIPLVFLAASSVLNIILDVWLVVGLKQGVGGAAAATILSQYISGIGIALYTWVKCPVLHVKAEHFRQCFRCIKDITKFSILTCAQQSVMNLGILMVQGLVNSFGPEVMAAFAAAVKIDAFAYMPVQDFGNAFSTFIAQNYGANKEERIQAGLKGAVLSVMGFCVFISITVWILARPLMLLFVDGKETMIVNEGIRYLHIEGAFYCGIGCLFLLYGLYRAIGKPGMSLLLTVLSLGTRVVLAYQLSSIPVFGVAGIWWSVPIGWVIADAVGGMYYIIRKKRLTSSILSHSSSGAE